MGKAMPCVQDEAGSSGGWSDTTGKAHTAQPALSMGSPQAGTVSSGTFLTPFPPTPYQAPDFQNWKIRVTYVVTCVPQLNLDSGIMQHRGIGISDNNPTVQKMSRPLLNDRSLGYPA